jgi:hypothetical protein
MTIEHLTLALVAAAAVILENSIWIGERSPSLALYDSHRRDGIAAFHRLVPARDGVDRKLGGVVINAHAAGVGGDFVDAVAPIEAALGPSIGLDGRTIGASSETIRRVVRLRWPADAPVRSG